jgi:palmitoyltransferase ZDHHC9/14/18
VRPSRGGRSDALISLIHSPASRFLHLSVRPSSPPSRSPLTSPPNPSLLNPGGIATSFVPKGVLTQQGALCDANAVVREVFNDGDTLTVNFGVGPEAFTSRWEGRPSTPPFEWGPDETVDEMRARDRDWLARDLDLRTFGIDELVAESVEDADADLAAALEKLNEYGGALQALFKIYESWGGDDKTTTDKMTLAQFRDLCRDSKVVSDGKEKDKKGAFKAEAVDECFEATLAQNLRNHAKGAASESSIGIKAFFVALLRVAAKKYGVGKENGFAELSLRLNHFVSANLLKNCGSPFNVTHADLKGCVTDEATALLAKGRRLTEKTLWCCQLARTPGMDPRLSVNDLERALRRWKVIDSDAASSPRGEDGETPPIPEHITMLEYTRICIDVKQDVGLLSSFETQSAPFRFDDDEFETFLLRAAFMIFKKRREAMKPPPAPEPAEDEEEKKDDDSDDDASGDDGDEEEKEPEPVVEEETFEEYLGTFLDKVYRASGALLDDSLVPDVVV